LGEPGGTYSNLLEGWGGGDLGWVEKKDLQIALIDNAMLIQSRIDSD